jgi:hypothetical protein
MTSSIATSGPTAALDSESSNEEVQSQATSVAPAPAIIFGRADEPPTDLPRTSNKQCVGGIVSLLNWDANPAINPKFSATIPKQSA